MADINFKWDYIEQQYSSDSSTSYSSGIPGEVGISLDVNSNIPTLKISYYFVMDECATGFAVSIDTAPSYDRFTGWTGIENKTYSSITTAGVTATIYVRWDTTDANVLLGGQATFTVYIPYPKPITEYTLTYNSNGGVGGPASIQIPDYVGTLLISDKVPTRNGYIFQCWNSSIDGGGSSYTYGDTITLSNNITLYAIWRPVYFLLACDGNGGINTQGESEFLLFLDNSFYGGEIQLPPCPLSREGYKFIGWYLRWNNSYLHSNTGSDYTWETNINSESCILVSDEGILYNNLTKLPVTKDGATLWLVAQWEQATPLSYIFDGTEFKEVFDIKVFDGSTFKDVVGVKNF